MQAFLLMLPHVATSFGDLGQARLSTSSAVRKTPTKPGRGRHFPLILQVVKVTEMNRTGKECIWNACYSITRILDVYLPDARETKVEPKHGDRRGQATGIKMSQGGDIGRSHCHGGYDKRLEPWTSKFS